jgi:High potential iron-sulfur protein
MTDKRGSKASRRTVLWTGMSAVAAILIPARAGSQAKIAQKMVQYQEKPKGPQECDNCLQFVAPGSCKLVEGKINPKGWCQLYAQKPK